MPISKLEIEGLRGFGLKQSLELAIPNGKFGSGLTILVGPNNSGKSTIIEVFRAFSQREAPSFTVGRRNQKTSSKVNLKLINHLNGVKTIKSISIGGSESEIINKEILPSFADIYVIPSRRYFDPFFSKGELSRSDYIGSSQLPAIRGSVIHNFYNRLFRIQNNRKNFNDVLKKVVENLNDWTIEQSDQGSYYLKFMTEISSHSSEGISDGIVSLFFIVDSLYDSKPGDIIVIDEPELSLHPAFQQKLSSLISEYSQDRQIILATHSPYFLNLNSICNGAKIARLHLDRDHNCTISSLSKESEDNIGRLLNDLNNPHVFGLNAKEVFFLEDKIILVEGQEDVVFYKIALKELAMVVEGEFFGWGVGGADKMKIISKILHDLGFKKVVGILDKNKALLIAELETAFPEYHFYAIPTDDVRTKKATEAKRAVDGLLDDNKKIRIEYIDQVAKIFTYIKDHLNSSL